MSDLLRIGAQGVAAYRGALATIGDNVANAETKGYSRRDVKLSETAILGPGQPLYNNIAAVGGVKVSAIDRAWDAFKTADARRASADSARADAQLRWLTVAETALDDGDTGVSARLTHFYAAADTLAADPGGTAPRRGMLIALEGVTKAMTLSAEGLANASAGIGAEAQTATAAITNDLHALADVNTAIRRVASGTTARAQLEDERDRLLDSLNDNVSIDVTLNDAGMATVRANGPGGPLLLDGLTPALVEYRMADDGRLSMSTTIHSETSTLTPSGGTMAGLVDSARSIADRRQTLDTIANDFVAQLNAWSTGGVDKNGAAGQPLLAGTGAAGLTVAITDPAQVAAGKAGGAANGNLLLLKDQRTAGGAEARSADLVTDLAQQLASVRTQSGALSIRRDNALAARDDVSGIDLDREAAELLRYQQAYDGSAKILQVARETMQSILNLF